MRMNSYLTSGASNSSGSGTTARSFSGIGAVGDDQEFAIEEAIRSRRIGRAGQRHRKRVFSDVFLFHGGFFLCSSGVAPRSLFIGGEA